jgi:hypothetical protein
MSDDKPLSASKNTKAFLWIAAGRSYLEEAGRSARTVKALHPDADLFLVSPDTALGVPSVFNFYITAPNRRGPHWYLDSTRYFLFSLKAMERYSRIIYLDTDTRVLHSLEDVFSLLGRFHFVGAHAPGRITRATVNPIPHSFPEVNIGTLGLHNGPILRKFVLEWLTRYEKHQTLYGNNDQASLRETLWRSKAKIDYYILPPEYNFRFGFGGWARYPIHVLHGRTQDWPTLIEDVNENAKGFRGWGPGELGQ